MIEASSPSPGDDGGPIEPPVRRLGQDVGEGSIPNRSLAPAPATTPPGLSFVERKQVSPHDLVATLQPAITENQHTNFGPVSAMLERTLWRLNGANPSRAAISTSSGTSALQAVVATLANWFGHPLRWVITDFGFVTNFIGPFADQRWVPCRADGFISIEQLERIDLGDFDAVLATNVFGVHEDFSALFRFCREAHKALVIDNAGGFPALAPYHEASSADDDFLWAEVISLHHTKPWGMGEGGAAFLPASLADTCRAAINFGVGFGEPLRHLQLCTNGKMSEIAAAQILIRARAHEEWAPPCRDQALRIWTLGCDAGLTPLVEALPRRIIPGHLPFLSDRPLPLDEVRGYGIPMLKYYAPAPQSGAQARRLYRHIVNIPCNPDFAAVPDHLLSEIFRKLATPR